MELNRPLPALTELRQAFFTGQAVPFLIEIVKITNALANAVIVASLGFSLFRKIRAVKLVSIAWTNHINVQSTRGKNGS